MINLDKIRLIFLKYQLLFIVGILVMLIGLLAYHAITIINNSKKITTIKKITNSKLKNENSMVRRKIDGLMVDKKMQNLYPVAINIDNHFRARPNFGLSKANIVYETLVEGGTTRFLALYTLNEGSSHIASKIGPVRSTRPYFVELAYEYKALLAHAGGSPEGLKLIEKLGISNLEEIAWWGPDYFWRVYSRKSPHNLFSSSKNLAQAVVDWKLGKAIPEYRGWKFNEQIKNNLTSAQYINIDFAPGSMYDVSYKYSTSTQSYLRYQSNEKHIDGLTNKQIEVKNVIIQFIPEKKILDSKGRLKLNLIGKGKALIFRDGVQIHGNWKKLNINSRTIFYDSNENEINFAPGNIWLEIVPGDLRVKIK